jgi:NAD(P)-dependent dehydrogenase (short-subunit alcohol dehydrogenase family)
MDLGLTGKRAIVTGGSRGIGRAIVDLLTGEGAHVAYCARTAAAVEETAQAFADRGSTLYRAALDVRDAAAFDAFMANAATALGGVDILVSNVTTRIHTKGDQMWRDCFEVDLLQHIRAVEAALPRLLETGAGSVVFVSSIASVLTNLPPGEEGYGAMKAALLNVAGQLAAKHGAAGLRVNSVSPGPILFPGGFWDMVRSQAPASFERAAKLPALGRLGTDYEVARAVVFLASPAASYISGANLRVDGAAVKTSNF